MDNRNWDAEIKEFRGKCHSRTVMKDGSAWFIARDVFDYVGYHSENKSRDISQVDTKDIPEILSYLEPDNINSMYSLNFKHDLALINVSGIRELASLWFDDKWNNVDKGVQEFLDWVRDESILLQILNPTAMAIKEV